MTADRPALAWWNWRLPGETQGQRIQVLTTGPDLLWHGDDIVTALDIDLVGRLFDDALELPGWTRDDDTPIPFLVTARVQLLATGRTAFLEFIDRVIAAHALPTEQPHRHPTGLAAVPAPADAREGTYTVLQAAQILSRDPHLDFGRQTLVDALRQMSWVFRNGDGHFVPSELATERDWLRLNEVWIPNSRIAFNKIRITPVGLLEIHRRLGGTAALDLHQPAAPTLVEV